MRMWRIMLIGACLIGLAQPISSQQTSQQAKEAAAPGVLGYLDPQTGAFRPVAQGAVESPEALAAIAPTTGKFVFSFTITIDSAIPTTDVIACSANATTFEATSGRSMEESASVKATRSGSTATCTVTIPYSWPLSSPSTDMVTLSYSVSAPFGGTLSTALPSRLSSQTIATIKVPANGFTTSEIINSTI